MDSKSYDYTLPPLKRYKLHHQQTQNHPKSPQRSNLPAKKRKLSRILAPPTPTYSLPAKKRIWAINPIHLNLQIPQSNSPNKTQTTQIHHQNVEIHDQNVLLDDENAVFDVENVVFDLEKVVIDVENVVFDGEKVVADKKNVDFDVEKVVIDDKNVVIDEEEEEDGIVCSICQSTDGDSQDPIVLCDGCDVMVHCSCYGHPLNKGVPEGDWFCQQCKSSSRTAQKKSQFSCCLCPVSGGAMKATTDGKWAHVVCALFVPEAFFEDPEGREGVDCSMVPKARFEGVCYLCGSKNGCVLDCCEKNCALSFHVMCGVNEELCVEYQQGKKKTDVVAGFCKKHTDLWQRQQQTGKYKIVAKD